MPPQRNLDTTRSVFEFVRRLTRQRTGEVYDVDVKPLYGFQAGLWSTPTHEHALPRGIGWQRSSSALRLHDSVRYVLTRILVVNLVANPVVFFSQCSFLLF